MPRFSQILSCLSPSLLRFIRTGIFMDVARLQSALPERGLVVEIGCGYGPVISRLAEARPDLSFLGVDIDATAVAAARRMWPRPNLSFALAGEGPSAPAADLVMLLHVLHHVPDADVRGLLGEVAGRLRPGGGLWVEEMDQGRCGFGVFLDTHISRCPPIVRTEAQLRALVMPWFEVTALERFRRAQIGRVSLRAQRREASAP